MAVTYIIDALRSPVGRRRGGLADVHPIDLGAHVIRELVKRNDIDPADIDDVIFGCVDNIGPQAGNIGRSCALAAGLPEAVPGVTVDRQCGSSQQAVQFATMGIASGMQDLVIAGGVQNMTQLPISSAMIAGQQYGFTTPFAESKDWHARYGNQPVDQFNGADGIAKKWDISREDMERFALESHTRAIQAIQEGRFKKEIVPLNGVEQDEGPRPDTTLEKMAGLKTLQEGGRITAAVASQISDGSSAMLLASEAAVKKYNLKPRARIVHVSTRGADPILMLTAPIPATQYALKKAGMKMSDIDLVEINEAFASVAIAWLKDMDMDYDELHARTNVNGGAIALGHPLGATGTKLMTTLLHELERTGKRFGLQTMCEGGGCANVTIIERL